MPHDGTKLAMSGGRRGIRAHLAEAEEGRSMLTMTVIAQVKPGKLQELVSALNSLYSKREEEKGLRKSMLYQEMNDPNSFRLITEWETKGDLEGYLRAEKFSVLLGALQILCSRSEIRYSELDGKKSESVEAKA